MNPEHLQLWVVSTFSAFHLLGVLYYLQFFYELFAIVLICLNSLFSESYYWTPTLWPKRKVGNSKISPKCSLWSVLDIALLNSWNWTPRVPQTKVRRSWENFRPPGGSCGQLALLPSWIISVQLQLRSGGTLQCFSGTHGGHRPAAYQTTY